MAQGWNQKSRMRAESIDTHDQLARHFGTEKLSLRFPVFPHSPITGIIVSHQHSRTPEITHHPVP